MKSYVRPLSLRVGPHTVSVKRPGQSRICVARVLGCDYDDAGHVVRIYLDRLVHERSDAAPEGWDLSGAISTVLTPPASYRLPSESPPPLPASA